MDKDQIKPLIEKYLNGTASPQEVSTVETWYNTYIESDGDQPNEESIELSTDRILARLQQLPQKKTIQLWKRAAIAASIVSILGIGAFFYATRSTNYTQQITAAADIAPGKNGATLTLANGKKIYINSALTGNIANESGVKISKTADGQIVYEIVDASSSANGYNSLTTTRGEQTQVRLPDGTLVFLNAESSLRYPTSFVRLDKRIVSLTGEGYFEVAKDKTHPFVVKTNKQSLEVLGTHFNVDSYEDKLTTTTLIEGSVKVSTLNGDSRILKPNEQSVLSNAGIEVSKVEAEYAIAWKEGFFMFNNESLGGAMEKIARWYNVEVVFEDETLKKKVFIGAISRFEHISEVLKMLEKTKVATFTMDKDKLIIKRKIK